MSEAIAPQRESRVKKTLTNAKVGLSFYLLALILSFFSRKLFLNCLGTDFIGLTSTLQNLLGFLNLAELGIGSAIGYVLYKPLFNQDRESINEIISVMGYLYRWIGIIILIGGIILSAFIPIIFPKASTGFEYPIVFFVYYAFLSSSLIGYFINYRQNLLGADQRNYVVAGYYQTCNIVKTLIQIGLAYYTGSYYLWALIEICFGIIYSVILNHKISQTYPWLKTEIKKGKQLLKKHSLVLTKTKQLFIQKISAFVQYQTVPFLTYSFVNLNIVALYGNYTIITDKLAQLINTLLDSTQASIGNLIAEGNKKKTLNIFWQILSMRYFIAGIASFAIFTLINPFISLWLGPEYLLPNYILYFIVINILLSFTRGAVMQFLFGYGMFSDIWAPIAEIVINLTVAIICGSTWGLPGVLCGGIVSQILIVFIWKPIYLFKKGFESSMINYIKEIATFLICIFIPAYLCINHAIPLIPIDPNNSFLSWIAFGITIIAIYSFGITMLMLLLSKGFRSLINRILHRN